MRAVAIWIWFCAYCNCAGWFLSAIHELNAVGYVVALAIWFASLIVFRKQFSLQPFPKIHWQKIRRRFKKTFPLAFLILAAIALLGGAIYPPNDYDGLAYRIPRILHWLTDGRWHWIHTIFYRVNTRTCGIEWVSAPFIAIFKTDRFLFLINFVSFLFLPGLVFSVFTRLGVRRRVAWHWMWILPTGYGFLLQAGSINSDLFSAPFALAAVDFALRARISGSPRDFFASIFAAALMTSPKLSSIPLGLPWLIALWPSLKFIRRWPAKTFAVCALAVFASALPTMFLNQKFSGDWSGMTVEQGTARKNRAVLFSANIVLTTIENFAPPIFPQAGKWNDWMDKNLPEKIKSPLEKNLEYGGCHFHLPEMQTEEDAGLGFGVSVLFLASVIAAGRRKEKELTGDPAEKIWRQAVRWSPWISAIVLMVESDLTMVDRYFIPYYALLMCPLLLHPAQGHLVKKFWWRAAAFAVFFIAAGLLIISPAHPLFPATTITEKLSARHPDSKLLARMKEVYSVYHERNDAFAPAKEILPPDTKVLGLTAFDEPETSLWRPFGSRRIIHVCPDDSAAYLKSRGVEYILAKDEWFGKWIHSSRDEWLKKVNAQIVKTIPLNLRASVGPVDWYLIKLN